MRATPILHSLLFAVLALPPGTATAFTVAVVDAAGQPVAEAVVVLRTTSGLRPRQAPATLAEMRQRRKRFVPGVVAVEAGGALAFPNDDPFMHHVYSFSPARAFDIELYGNTEVPNIDFGNPGVAVLGCNIHDEMRGYVFVADSPWFAVTDADGVARFDLAAGEVERIETWHPHQRGGLVTVAPAAGVSVQEVVVDLALPPPALPGFEAGDY